MLYRITGALSVLFVLSACGGSPRTSPGYRVMSLPSGEQVKVLGVAPMSFAESGPALMLRYQTDVNLDDTLALRAEADRIWVMFRVDADSAHVRAAILSANAAPSGGIVSRGRGYNFIYQKDSAGTWVPLTRRSSP